MNSISPTDLKAGDIVFAGYDTGADVESTLQETIDTINTKMVVIENGKTLSVVFVCGGWTTDSSGNKTPHPWALEDQCLYRTQSDAIRHAVEYERDFAKRTMEMVDHLEKIAEEIDNRLREELDKKHLKEVFR